MRSFTSQVWQILTNPDRFGIFVFEDKCVPWRVRIFLKKHFLRLYRILRYGHVNINTSKRWDHIWAREGTATWRQYPVRFSRICEIVPAGAHVLDVGCGVGVLLKKIQSEEQCRVVGSDISLAAIRRLSDANIEGIVAALPDLPLAAGIFDVVIATEVIEHLDHPMKAFRELARCLRSGGMLVVTVPNDTLAPWEQDEHMHVFTRDSLSEMAEGVLFDTQIEVVRDTSEARCDECLLLRGMKK